MTRPTRTPVVVRQVISELRQGLRDGRYVRVECRLCGGEVGVVPKWFHNPAFTIYCGGCVAREQEAVRKQGGTTQI